MADQEARRPRRPGRVMSRRGFERLVNFSDAVVAIALTLLVLPLASVTAVIGRTSVATIIHDHSDQLFAFLLSFVVIAVLWIAHHRVIEAIDTANNATVRWNFLWLLGIVFLPFPTALLAGQSEAAGPGPATLYIFTLLVSSFALRMVAWEAKRHPEFLTEAARENSPFARALGGWLTCLLLSGALLVTIFVPDVGTTTLLLLLLDRPIEVLSARRRASSNKTKGSAADD